MALQNDTIAALATAQGYAGIGIIRISGVLAYEIGESFNGGCKLTPRYAHYGPFFSLDNEVLDIGISIYFPCPNSFTGEDVVELHAHGGPVVLDLILQECIKKGARLASPGEFSQRAFLNDKIDLVQAEAVADLIEASSSQAARNAVRSLQGSFSKRITSLTEKIVSLRIQIEAAVDFPEEEVDLLSRSHVTISFNKIYNQILEIISEAEKGVLMQEGIKVIILGPPNAGKSTLFNALVGKDAAIVTDISGTTRDILKEKINIDGIPVNILDTAGLCDTNNKIERIGITRAIQSISESDYILLVNDSRNTVLNCHSSELNHKLLADGLEENLKKVIFIRNKVDLTEEKSQLSFTKDGFPIVSLSAQSNSSLRVLRDYLKSVVIGEQTPEGVHSARRRHISALESTLSVLNSARNQLSLIGAEEILAQDLRQAQDYLGEITGSMSSDELLGKIFSGFCIGK